MMQLIPILEKSIEKHGKDHPITLGHLLNILKMARRIDDMKDENLNAALDKILTESRAYGSDNL